MSSNILGELANATKALSAHRFGVTTAGNNLANVNNPEYARQRVVIGEDGVTHTLVGPKGTGVEVQGFEHMRDMVLDREMVRETSLNASLEAQQAALSKAEASLGQEIDRTGDSPFIDGATADGGGSGGIAETLNNFFNAMHSLSANPASDAEKEAMLQKAQILTEKLNVTAERFVDLNSDLALQVETDIGAANRIVKEIARLNSEIARAESTQQGQALSLRDHRQALLEDLSSKMQIRSEEIPGSSGQIRVYVPTVGGMSPTVDLVEKGRFKQVEMDDTGPNPVFSIVDEGTQIEIRGGSIHGSLTARDGAIATYARGLDDLAIALATEVNKLYNEGTATSNTNFFQATDLADIAETVATELGGSVSAASIQSAIDTAGVSLMDEKITEAAQAIATALGASSPSLGNIEAMIASARNRELTAANIRLDPSLSAESLRTTNDPNQHAGDNTLVLAIAELDETRLDGSAGAGSDLGNRTMSTFYRSIVTNLGESSGKVESRLDDESIVFNLLREQRDSVSGVSIDEEMTDMMKYQRAYEATGKLIRAIDEMLDVIVNRLI